MEMVTAYTAINAIDLGHTCRVRGKDMSGFDVKMLLMELAELCCPRTPRTDAEWREVDLRRNDIARQFGEMFPEDVFERFA